MKSRITPGNEGISALTNTDRPMVGQSEYVVNAGLGYASPSGGWFGNSALQRGRQADRGGRLRRAARRV